MKDLAPDILRQKLLIEGFYKLDIDKKTIKDYFNKITNSLKLKMYGEPIIFSPNSEGKEEVVNDIQGGGHQG